MDISEVDPLALPAGRLAPLLGANCVAWDTLTGCLIDLAEKGIVEIRRIEPRNGDPLLHVIRDGRQVMLNSRVVVADALVLFPPGEQVHPCLEFEAMPKLLWKAKLAEIRLAKQIAADTKQKRLDHEQEVRRMEEVEKLERRTEALALIERVFSCSSVETVEANPSLLAILQKVDGNIELHKSDINYMESVKDFGPLAHHSEQQFVRHRNAKSALKACRYWRRACRPDRTIDLSRKIINMTLPTWEEDGLKASAWTTCGAAFRDKYELDEAESCAFKAIELEETFYPHRLLGAIYWMGDEHQRGLSHFDRACELDCNCISPSRQIESEVRQLKAHDYDAARRAAAYLFDRDPIAFSWAEKYC
jgi:tetratricopeptide (TPR) repeat protein